MRLRRFAHVIAVLSFATVAAGTPRLATTAADFHQPGSQPAPATFGDLVPASPLCSQCHGGYRDDAREPYDAWSTSMMAQAARDPLTRAAASIAQQDAATSGETCIRCHSPIGWLNGRSTGGDFGALQPSDLDGITCHVCHRLVDPITRADAPAADAAIVGALAGDRPDGSCRGAPAQSCVADAECGASGPCELRAGQGRFVVDPDDARRGPRSFGLHLHPTTFSPFHQRADACASCHDVSTPTYTRQPDGTYVLNALDAAHPTQDPNAMFPEQRTFSEWRASAFAGDGVVFPDGRFGGTRTATLPNVVAVSSCQDCHMPGVSAEACQQGALRGDSAGHFFAGANTWVLGAVLDEYGSGSGLSGPSVTEARERTAAMLQRAADVDVSQHGYTLTVRVTNQTGHKLPTGYPEGRRLWLTVRFFAGDGTVLLSEDGAYDDATATLDLAHTTKAYETHHEMDAAVGIAADLPEATRFHLVLSNRIASDNRIPPRGFVNAAFDAFGGAPVGATYADGQHWDDTSYVIPLAATRVQVLLRYQTTTREYAEFLRDQSPDASGQNAYDRWVARERSAPVTMVDTTHDLGPICTPEGSSCDDANPCTTGDTCTGGACEGTPVSCPDDGNPCTDDVCVLATGTCGAANTADCDDSDACSAGDRCDAAACDGTLASFDGARCETAAIAAPDVCTPRLSAKLRRFVAQRARAAGRLFKVAAKLSAHGKTRPAVRAIGKAHDLLERIGPKLDTARAAPDCQAELARRIARIATAVPPS